MRMLLAPLSVVLGFLGVTLVGFTASAHAAEAVVDDGNLVELARPVFDEIMKGNYVAASALTLVLLVALVKRYAPGKFGQFVHSDVGGALTTLLMSFGGALATATMGGAAWSWGMFWAAGGIALTAAGGYSLIKKLIVEPLLRPLMSKLPAWARPILAMVMWVFDKPTTSAQAIKAAEVAGDVAVITNPATGADGVTGEAKDL